MSNDFDDAAVEPETIEGRSWPCLRQFSVFLANRVGRLHDLLRQLERPGIRILGMSAVDSVEFAVIRLIVDDTDLAREIFDLNGFTYIEHDIIGVELPEGNQPFVDAFVALLSAEINISYAYPLLWRRHGRGAIALYVESADQAMQILRNNGITVLEEGDLKSDDDHFG